jgi:RHS repeat-associated protein
MNANGELVEKAYYLPWGGERGDTSITSTDYGYTGQMREGDIYYYGARWYDPAIGRFMQADTIVPLQVQGTQAFDRYAYVNNNPLRYTDPSGHHIGVNYRMTDGSADGYPVIIDYMLMRLEEDYGSLTNDYNAILETYGQYAYNHPGLFFYEGANVIKTFLVNSDYGKPYDLKEALNEFFFPGEDNRRKYTLIDEYYYFFDIWGNMYYGYMGARLGLPKEVLLQGAGWAQQRNDNPAVIRNQNTFMCKKYDYPTDQAAISKGYDLWKEHGGSITPQNVLDVLDVTLDRLLVLP